MMVYNFQNYLVYGLCFLSGILNNYKTTFRTLDQFPSSGDWRETPVLLGPLERADLNQCAHKKLPITGPRKT
jgi:hypothetical protein